MRWDFFGISCLLSTNYALWATHFHWSAPEAARSFVVSAAILAVAFHVFETDARGHTCGVLDPAGVGRPGTLPGPRSKAGLLAIKALMLVQYALLLGHLCLTIRGTPCGVYTAGWWAYLPGFLAYACEWPADGAHFGSHDVFHGFVVLGHLASAGFDLMQSARDCTAG